MNPLIECCEQNLSKGDFVLSENKFLQENSDLITYSCMNECVLCAQSFYALFEGERVTGKTPEELIEKLTAEIYRWQEEML
ncbi:DUF1450 domain-containing protein [Enterococcus sp. BWM-S5]|uniref:DUF1450 domain-containing protein n=1 Tax=Enterococcus larvae TaxID=2794352 RepID=A0ABS4CQQ7_9ENTE|nr:DUF1450 domain-containing protein [Enterococcus larvae]MBP1048503.1 DUF1450 domain-containing protein [Enterococcus larvae]